MATHVPLGLLLLLGFACFPSHVTGTDTDPIYLTLAFAGPGGMAVSWKTPENAASEVFYGTSSRHLNMKATGESITYGKDYGYQHHVVLSNLKPFTTYYYSAGSPGSMSTTRNFTTAMEPGSNVRPWSVVVYGDMGIDNSKDTISDVTKIKDSVDFYLHVGDISYADDWVLRFDTYEGTYNYWLKEMMPITSTKAYMVLPGNHEATCSEVTPFLCEEHQKNFTEYLYRFRMPFKESGAVNNMWYSFDYGLVHFVNIDTETDFKDAPEVRGTWLASGPFGDQLGWLENDLKKAQQNRDQVPWVVVSGHRPLYTRSDQGDTVRKAFEELFHKYAVDLYFCGHVHWYERNYPVYKNKVTQKNYHNANATIYIISGSAGNVEGLSFDPASPYEYSAFLNNDDFGYGILKTHNASCMEWTQYKAKSGAVLDGPIYITKDSKQ